MNSIMKKAEVVQAELLPCPFCGGEAVVVELGLPPFGAICSQCNCEGPAGETGATAIAAWNTRLTHSSPPPTDDYARGVVAQAKLEAQAEALLAVQPDQGYSDGGLVFTYGQAHRAVVAALSNIEAINARIIEAQPIETAPKDDTTVWLLIDYSGEGGAPLADASLAWTIGFNGFDNTGLDEWKFAGWCWSHDHFTEGRGKVLAWKPFGFEINADDDPATSRFLSSKEPPQ